MKQVRTRFAAALLLLPLAAAVPATAFAQAAAGPAEAGAAPAAALMTDGEIRKIDKEAGKITIKHGDIKHMDMPGMTMVFTAKDKALLDTPRVGDKIRFMVVSESGKMVLTAIEPAR